MSSNQPEVILLEGRTPAQQRAIKAKARRLLIVAGAGSGKTDVIARKVAWWVAVDGVDRDRIVAFTFTEAAAEELKFRIRQQMQAVAPPAEDVALGGMYVGTIHGFCLKTLRETWPNEYYSYDVIDEAARLALVHRGYNAILGLRGLQTQSSRGQTDTIGDFLKSYDLLNEYDQLDVQLPNTLPPPRLEDEAAWCKQAALRTNVGTSSAAKAFADSAARFYAYLRCRRFLDFSTSQAELARRLRTAPDKLAELRTKLTHIVVDEFQDVNQVQDTIIRQLVGNSGNLVAVGDHRQAIYAWRGGRVDIMGALYDELKAESPGNVAELPDNFRSTSRIIKLANGWATTIGQVKGMSSPAMSQGRSYRQDYHKSHVACLSFDERAQEAEWIAGTIKKLVASEKEGARHDVDQNIDRGLHLSDVAILLRSSTDARTYMRALERAEIPAVFRAGPDLFSQPEVLSLVGALGISAGIPEFYDRGPATRSLPKVVRAVLGQAVQPKPPEIATEACRVLRQSGITLQSNTEKRLSDAAQLIARRINSSTPLSPGDCNMVRSKDLKVWLTSGQELRRVFPQAIYHFLLEEAGVGEWIMPAARARSVLFHLGQLSTLIKGMETPGWTSASDFKYQVLAVCTWGAENARTEQAPLLVDPDAVTITTIHGAKGLEFPAVFVADVAARRFPSSQARKVDQLLIEGPIRSIIDPNNLADNVNYDNERRLMYVAITRAERFLFITWSGNQTSQFARELRPFVVQVGGTSVNASQGSVPSQIGYAVPQYKRDIRLVTSFSDLRYYWECPQDFYLRKVLGFAPTIDQAFGYGRGVHSLMRVIHSDAKTWAGLSENELRRRLQALVDTGAFYLRYTTGEPAENMRKKAQRVVADYVKTYSTELAELVFEPEREFETLIPEEQVLVSGAIDVIRLDNPPRVTLIDFKSGDPDSDLSLSLDEDQMKLQISLYGIAAKKELQYEPDRGLVRYLDESNPFKRELQVNLDDTALKEAREKVRNSASEIRQRLFDTGPRRPPRKPGLKTRCGECDFRRFCPRSEARALRAG